MRTKKIYSFHPRLLSQNYQLKIPTKEHWVGQGLDTFTTYTNRSIYSLNLFSQNFSNLLCKDYLVSADKVYHAKKNLDLENSTDKSLNDSISGIWKTYKIINDYVCKKIK